MKALRILAALTAAFTTLALSGCKADVDDDSVTVKPAAKVEASEND